MKKLSVFTLAIAVISLASTFQATAQTGFQFSVKGAPQFSWLMNSDDMDNNSIENLVTFGGAFGIGGNYNLATNMGIGLDVLYSLQGQSIKTNGIETAQHVSYLKIPIMLSYNTNPDFLMFFGKIGPQINILTDSKLSDGDGNDIIADTKSSYEDLTVGIMANVGIRLMVARNMSIDAGLRFDYDFTNAENEDSATRPVGRAATNNMSAALQIGFNYGL